MEKASRVLRANGGALQSDQGHLDQLVQQVVFRELVEAHIYRWCDAEPAIDVRVNLQAPAQDR